MGNKRKGQLTTDIEWHKHLRKIGKRFFWKGERLAEKKMIEQKLAEIETESAEILYDYLNLKLPNSLNYKELYNLYYSLFCTLDILPENLKSLKLTKETLALTFAKLSTVKNISKLPNQHSSELLLISNIQNKKYWIQQIGIFMKADKWPNHENARKLIGTK
ncbi:hypothetical protein [Winogradskyella schleiferi]|uniref:hypothetical protein n=1 Tax=Winogradskyella schleiferi TaxID=2686078 RepID=UPI0015B7EBF6|nr:hypothetical protein [Winogradskyella schleiferi]